MPIPTSALSRRPAGRRVGGVFSFLCVVPCIFFPRHRPSPPFLILSHKLANRESAPPIGRDSRSKDDFTLYSSDSLGSTVLSLQSTGSPVVAKFCRLRVFENICWLTFKVLFVRGLLACVATICIGVLYLYRLIDGCGSAGSLRLILCPFSLPSKHTVQVFADRNKMCGK